MKKTTARYSWKIEVTDYDDGTRDIKRTNDGFTPFMLIKFLIGSIKSLKK